MRMYQKTQMKAIRKVLALLTNLFGKREGTLVMASYLKHNADIQKKSFHGKRSFGINNLYKIELGLGEK